MPGPKGGHPGRTGFFRGIHAGMWSGRPGRTIRCTPPGAGARGQPRAASSGVSVRSDSAWIAPPMRSPSVA